MTWCNAHDAKMKCNGPNKTPTKLGTQGRYLKFRSWGVTTLHDYERISSRDLEWHQREKRKRKRRGKAKLLNWQTNETKEPWEVEQIERQHIAKMNKVENTPLEKRDKEEQLQTALWLERYARLDKMKELEQRAHTPVKWVSTGKNMILDETRWLLKKATSQSLRNKSKNGMGWTKENKISR